MDPVIDNDWHTCKNESSDKNKSNVGNVVRSLFCRELNINPMQSQSNKAVLENAAEDNLVQKNLTIKSCDLPGYPRSTFLMVFSPDGTKVASTHGNHNVYVSELASGKHVRILKGHPRTPWCIAFHPSHPELIGSGCLGGQVRVWDISTGGSEVWNVQNATVIASIAFHPREQLLVIATYNELYFWDWSQPAPFTKVSTNNVNEKVRYVAFDALGYKLITGISLWSCTYARFPIGTPTSNVNNTRREDPSESPGSSGNRGPENPGSAQDMIVNSYQNLVQRYDSLVRNYHRLFMAGRLTNSQPPPNTTDRGTDPMETDLSSSAQNTVRNARPSTSAQLDDGAGPSTSRRQEGSDSGDGEGSSSRLLNLDILSFDPGPSTSRNTQSRPEHTIFGSRSSAFQPLNDYGERSFRAINGNERINRFLPNPFSSQNNLSRSSRSTNLAFEEILPPTENSANTSRTSIFSPLRRFAIPRRNSAVTQHTSNITEMESLSGSVANNATSSLSSRASDDGSGNSYLDSMPSTSSGSTTSRPRTTNSATQMSPSAPVDAQTINESLDLIRDILRDSGTRLLNLITNMSLSTLASVERNMPRRSSVRIPPDSSDNIEDSSGRVRGTRSRVRFFDSSLVRNILLSSSDSDSDQTLEVNIFRTRNSTFREDEPRDSDIVNNTESQNRPRPTNRMAFQFNEDIQNEQSDENDSLSDNRFHVRTRSNSLEDESARNEENADNYRPSTSENTHTSRSEGESARNEEHPDYYRPSTSRDTHTPRSEGESARNEEHPDYYRPSTSRDTHTPRSRDVPPDEAFRKVKAGVYALHKHTIILTDLWLRGNRITMRELRIMWEDLRRRILAIHRETGRHDSPSYYTRTFLERCMMLNEMSNNNTNLRNSRNQTNETVRNSNSENSLNADSRAENISNENVQSEVNRSSQLGNRTLPTRVSNVLRTSSGIRRRLQPNYRWRSEDDARRRSRNMMSNRLSQRYPYRSRREIARAIEISATRHEIRMRAMQVLSVMFDMMMMCLEERGLSQLIITMLRTLKKALALTCLMLMINRNNGRSNPNPTTPSQQAESPNVIRIQNADHSGPIVVDDPDESATVNNPTQKINDNQESVNIENTSAMKSQPANSQSTSTGNGSEIDQKQASASNNNIITDKWSERLAVQIAAANRNHSVTARNRRDLYLESRRLKALHRTNPTAHPLIKKRVTPPVASYRIPALRTLPKGTNVSRLLASRRETQNYEPVAGPSNRPQEYAENQPNQQDPARSNVMNDFDERMNSIRIAHMQAIRLRNAARNRFRRLQTIRLYAPSSLQGREMFTIQMNSVDESSENRSPTDPQSGSESSNPNPRAFHSFMNFDNASRLINTTNQEPEPERDMESRQFQPVMDDVIVPEISDNVPSNPNSEVNQRLNRMYDTLQHLIVPERANESNTNEGASASNEAGPGGSGAVGIGGAGAGGGPGAGGTAGRAGVAGLLDAGIISEALPSPSHRVQAWDFTTGDKPDISNSSKNVVVQKCRIHNDASIDISKDGRLLVALLPVARLRLRESNHWLGVYSLEWERLGQCLHTAVLEQAAVSVALSPTARHLAVGLGSRRFSTTPHAHARTNVFALLFRLDPHETSSRPGLSPIKELEQNWEQSFTSLNCLRWAPQPGQGLVYANNTGQLIIMS